MKSLVVFYSRTGNTRKAAEKIKKALSAEIEEIKDKKKRTGPLGFFRAGVDAARRKLTDIEKPEKDPGKYELVIIGTPVWAGTITPAVRTYIEKYKKDLIRKKVAFFSTQGQNDPQNCFRDLEELLRKKPKACLSVQEEKAKKGDFEKELEEFKSALR